MCQEVKESRTTPKLKQSGKQGSPIQSGERPRVPRVVLFCLVFLVKRRWVKRPLEVPGDTEVLPLEVTKIISIDLGDVLVLEDLRSRFGWELECLEYFFWKRRRLV